MLNIFHGLMFYLVLITEVMPDRLNVLFLMSDDMRPDLGVYQQQYKEELHMYTPNLDKLASRSILFENAYVQQAVCSPSRTSMLTGRRPDTTRVHDLIQYWRRVAGNFTTLPQYFKENGYNTAGLGKVFHPGMASGNEDPISWTEKFFRPDMSYWNNKVNVTWFAASAEEVIDHPLPDNQILDNAVKMLNKLAPSATTGQHPFFLAVGFLKPHLPFIFPHHFVEHYPRHQISLPSNPYAPVNMPEVAWSNFDELRKYADIGTKYGYGSINTTFPDDMVIDLRRAYYASISYIDDLIGQLLEALVELGLADTTIVSFVGDHGWQLGEHGEWCKHDNFEVTTRAPVIIHIPRLTDVGLRTTALVEFVDIFPTLCEAAGLPVPSLCPESSALIPLCVEGVSLIPLVKNPQHPWKMAAFSQYPRMLVDGDIIMGYSMKTDTLFRYTEWVEYDIFSYTPMWNKSKHQVELYDHKADPDENVNVADLSSYRSLCHELSKMLRAGWRHSLPTILFNSSKTILWL